MKVNRFYIFVLLCLIPFQPMLGMQNQALNQKLFDLVSDIAKLIQVTGNEQLAMPFYEVVQKLLQDGASPFYVNTIIVSARKSAFGPDSFAPTETIRQMTADLLAGPIKELLNQTCQKIA